VVQIHFKGGFEAELAAPGVTFQTEGAALAAPGSVLGEPCTYGGIGAGFAGFMALWWNFRPPFVFTIFISTPNGNRFFPIVAEAVFSNTVEK